MEHSADVYVYPKNEVYVTVSSKHNHALQEISDYFTIEIPGAKFMPAYKKGWDGKLRLFSQKTGKLYKGLLNELIYFLSNQTNYSFLIDSSLKPTLNADIDVEDFISSLNLPFEPRDYQKKAIHISLTQKRATILSSTGSGKSLIIYAIARYVESLGERVLIIVPTISLTSQLFGDFNQYAFNDEWTAEDSVHVITAGITKYAPNQLITIATWQSIYEQPKEYFSQFRGVIIDESHGAKSSSLKRILENSTEASLRIGLTGTLTDTKTHILTIQGLLGPISQVSQTADLQNRNILANIEVKMVLLSYAEKDRKKVKHLNYTDEVDFLLQHEKRNKLIEKIVASQSGNTLVLASYVDKQGLVLYSRLKEQNPNKYVFFISGDMPKEEREHIRSFTETRDNIILVATYGVFSTGINIHRLHTIVFALAGKSKIRNLQSIGRGLRTHKSKSKLVLYDISDDLSIGNRKNYSYKHFEERYKQYIAEKFPVSFSTVNLYPKLNIESQ